jgi:hypothetical protein
MIQKISKVEKYDKKVVIVSLLLFLLLLPALALAATDDVEISVNVSISAVIEVTPATANFNLVTPGVDSFPGSLEFTITNKGSVNFTQMYVSLDVPAEETANPKVGGGAGAYRAGGFIVLMNETMLAAGSDNWRFVGRQEWNLTDKPSAYTPGTWAKAWGYFGNNSKEYFWDLTNGTNGFCNATDTQLRIKEWAVNGSAAAYDLSSDSQTYSSATAQADWAVYDALTSGPLAHYCVAARTDCQRVYIYQWDQGSQLDQCSSTWYIYDDDTEFTTNDQFDFNITVWIPPGIPAGDTSSSTLTVTAS